MGQSTAKQEGGLPAPSIVISVAMRGYIILCQQGSLTEGRRKGFPMYMQLHEGEKGAKAAPAQSQPTGRAALVKKCPG